MTTPPRPPGRTDEVIAADLAWIEQRLAEVGDGFEREFLEQAQAVLTSWLENG